MENSKNLSVILKKLPYDVIAFFLFALTVSTFSFYLDFDKEMDTFLVPYTGWSFGRGYLFPAFCIPLFLLSSKVDIVKTLIILRVLIIITMLTSLYDGVQDWLQVAPEDYTNPNPYLRYEPLRPVYSIITPLFWILLMAGMLLRSFLKKETAEHN